MTCKREADQTSNQRQQSVNLLRMVCAQRRASRQQKCRAQPEAYQWIGQNTESKIVHSDELDLNTPQTSGMTRAAAITHARAGASKLWGGTMVVRPDAKTGPHHHGELETVLYVVKGRIRMRWGDQLELSEEARPVTLFTFHLTCRTRRSMPAQMRSAKL